MGVLKHPYYGRHTSNNFALLWLPILVVLATKGSQSLNKTSFTKNNLETGGELSNLEERSNFEEKNFLEETNSLEERNNLKERSNLEENSNLKDTNNLDETSSLDKVEKRSNLEKAEDRRARLMQEILEERSNLEETNNLEERNNLEQRSNLEKQSNLEKAEDRRASLMQEILEEDLGSMKIRLIALERKVERLHPVVGGWCPWKYIGEAVFEESPTEKSVLKEITWQGRSNFEREDVKPHRSFVNHEEVTRWVRVCECPIPSQEKGFCNGTDIRERGEVAAWARDETAMEYGYGEAPWEDEEWKSFDGASKGLTCTRVSF